MRFLAASRPSRRGTQQPVKVPNVEILVEPVREHRFVAVFRGDELGDAVNDTDPQQTGHAPLFAHGANPHSANTADVVNAFVAEAARVLKNDAPLNMVTLRGFARYPNIQTMQKVYGLKPVAIAVYPMYKGLARLVGMDIADAGSTLADQMEALRRLWSQYDFFFLHYKYTDSTGEDGNFVAARTLPSLPETTSMPVIPDDRSRTASCCARSGVAMDATSGRQRAHCSKARSTLRPAASEATRKRSG